MQFEELKKLAATGRAAYQIELGHSYLEGINCPQDYSAARYWLEKAHKRGSRMATMLLGTIYERGLGVEEDIRQAIALYELATEVDNIYAYFYLARIFADEKSQYFDQEKAKENYLSIVQVAATLDDTTSHILSEAKEYLRKLSPQ